ncbi:histidine phosphatase family protein [Pleionea litopenaei]|uniref:Histidine phosphatase family protein n=1 Tax=Pleionea litopenaei TaxID=3070815 RepID=A0AA51X5K9_9GAMM|nr:histidine phosphatase family protein [Pleionea sp. HL-JVS1]WMS86078.1 histidine phosphatase family protein [Pleionea sp. HL-JVS1]
MTNSAPSKAIEQHIYLLRHGQPQLRNALLGHTDSHLDELGWSQMQVACDQLSDIERIVSSPLQRCAAFAEKLGHQLNQSIDFDSRLKECYFGAWDGLTYAELHRRYPEDSSAFFQHPSKHTPPDGEPLLEFHQRVVNGFCQQVQGCPTLSTLIITHAGVIRSLIAWCLEMTVELGHQFQRLTIDYGSITKLSLFHFEDKTMFPKLVQLNSAGCVV